MKPTIYFTETMSGHGTLLAGSQREADTTIVGYQPPEDQGFVKATHHEDEEKTFVMEWRDLDVAVSTTERSAEGGMIGTIERGVINVAGLSAHPLRLEEGRFELLPEVAPGERRMRYRLTCCTVDGGRQYTLHGFKHVERQPGTWRLWSLWQDTTTLYVTIYDDGSDGAKTNRPLHERKEIVGTGIIRIYPLAFAHQLLTFRSSGAGSFVGHILNYIRFFRFFSGSLLTVYFGSLPARRTQTV